jgi:SAM-dependent methyltransferase
MTHDSRHLRLRATKAHATPPTPTEVRTEERAEVEAYYRTIAPFYDAEQAGRHDLGFWRWVGERHPGGRVLELGAGSGRVTAVLAPTAGEVVGVDLSPELLRLARPRLARWPHARLVQADMLVLPFREPFDLIAAANDPLSHLVEAADRDRALAAVARHLAPGGRFVLDALWLAPSEEAKVAGRGGRVEQRTATMDGQRLQVLERWKRTDDARHCCHAHYEYRCGGRRPVVADFDAHDWLADELFTRLDRAGLVVTNVWGSYQGERWDPTRSSQFIVEAALA